MKLVSNKWVLPPLIAFLAFVEISFFSGKAIEVNHFLTLRSACSSAIIVKRLINLGVRFGIDLARGPHALVFQSMKRPLESHRLPDSVLLLLGERILFYQIARR